MYIHWPLVRFAWPGRGRFAQWTVGLAVYADPAPPLAVVGFQVPAEAPVAKFPGTRHLHGGCVPSRASVPVTIMCLTPRSRYQRINPPARDRGQFPPPGGAGKNGVIGTASVSTLLDSARRTPGPFRKLDVIAVLMSPLLPALLLGRDHLPWTADSFTLPRTLAPRILGCGRSRLLCGGRRRRSLLQPSPRSPQ